MSGQFALRFGPPSFAIFDTFPDDAARQAHLSREVAGSLMEKAPQLLAKRADVLAGKVDVAGLRALTDDELIRRHDAA